MPFEVCIDRNSEHPVITLKDTNTGCEAEIYAFGGLLNAFHIPAKGKTVNLIEGFDSVGDAKKNITRGFKSAKLSPFVCRMRNGRYRHVGITHRVNKHYLGEHAIHGLLYDAVYEIADPESNETAAGVKLIYRYTGSDNGYPFPYDILLNWKLQTGNKLSITTIITHHNSHPIPLADGWHPYFTLGGGVDDWTLQFNSQTQLEYDDDLLPTGKRITDTRFLQARSLRDVTLDNSFEFNKPDTQPQCVLSNDILRLTVEPDKAYPILQVYTPPDRKSIAIENLSGAPDNFNNGINLILLTSDQPKTFTTSYTVTVL